MEGLDVIRSLDRARLLELSFAEDSYVRFESLRRLNDCPPEDELKARYVELLTDPEEIVRVQAVENLADYRGHGVLVRGIIGCFEDDSHLVRGFAAVTLGWIGGDDCIKVLEGRLGIADAWEEINVLAGLILLGEEHYLSPLLALLTSPDYQVRCGIGNLCFMVASSDEMKRKVISSFEEALKGESSRAVETTLTPIVKQLQEEVESEENDSADKSYP